MGSPLDRDGIRARTRAASGTRPGGIHWVVGAALAALLGAPAHADDAEKAKNIVATVCSACHGADGNSAVPNFPKLAGFDPEYVVHELKQFKSGARKSDVMGPVVANVDPGDFKALGDYFGAQKRSPGKVQDAKAAEAGRKLYDEGDEQKGIPACGGCHGRDGAGSKRFPRLAGQHREYLVDQMNNFKAGKRDYPAARPMREVAKLMSADDIRASAEYLQGL
jgi:cytochrome c553